MNYGLLKMKLQEPYREVFEQVEIYADFIYIRDRDKAELLMDFMDLLLSAQQDKKPVEKITGPDVRRFCKLYFSCCSIKSRLLEFAARLYSMAWFVFIFEGLGVFLNEKNEGLGIFQMKTDLSGYVLGIALGIIIMTFVNITAGSLLFRWKKFSYNVYAVINMIFLIILFVLIFVIDVEKSIIISLFPVLLITGVYILIYIIIRAVWRYHAWGNIYKRDDPFKKLKCEMRDAEYKWQTIELYVNRYETMNAKRMKKGEAPITRTEYMEKLYQEESNERKTDLYYTIGVGIIILIIILPTVVNSETIADTLLFLILIFVITAVSAYFGGKFQKRTRRICHSILRECREKGIDIIEYKEKSEG